MFSDKIFCDFLKGDAGPKGSRGSSGNSGAKV